MTGLSPGSRATDGTTTGTRVEILRRDTRARNNKRRGGADGDFVRAGPPPGSGRASPANVAPPPRFVSAVIVVVVVVVVRERYRSPSLPYPSHSPSAPLTGHVGVDVSSTTATLVYDALPYAGQRAASSTSTRARRRTAFKGKNRRSHFGLHTEPVTTPGGHAEQSASFSGVVERRPHGHVRSRFERVAPEERQTRICSSINEHRFFETESVISRQSIELAASKVYGKRVHGRRADLGPVPRKPSASRVCVTRGPRALTL